MKKSFIVFIFMLFIIFFSCEKWDGCYDCSIHTEFLNVGPVIVVIDTTFEYCEFKDEDEMRYFEELNSYSNDNVIQEVKCIKK